VENQQKKGTANGTAVLPWQYRPQVPILGTTKPARLPVTP
jgi:hypothetical protein